MGSQRDVVYLGLTNSGLVYERQVRQNVGGVGAGYHWLCTAMRTWSPNKLWWSNCVYSIAVLHQWLDVNHQKQSERLNLDRPGHKVLTYIWYRAVSGVFRTIDLPPPLHSASVSSPRTKGGGYTIAGRWGDGGSIFSRFRKTPDTGLVSYSIISLRTWHTACSASSSLAHSWPSICSTGTTAHDNP